MSDIEKMYEERRRDLIRRMDEIDGERRQLNGRLRQLDDQYAETERELKTRIIVVPEGAEIVTYDTLKRRECRRWPREEEAEARESAARLNQSYEEDTTDG
jgi:hypothetical protein